MINSTQYLFPALVVLNFLNFSTYAIPATFYPAIAKENGISSFIVGFIFAMYPIGSSLSGLYIGKKLSFYNKKSLIIFAETNLGIAFTVLGLTSIISNKFIFVILGLASRLFQGISIGIYQTAAYTYIPQYWPDQIELSIGILEFSISLGIGLGPLMGSALYHFGNIVLIYVVPSFLLIGLGYLLVKTIIPEEESTISDEITEKLSLIESFANFEIFPVFLALSINYGSFTLLIPEFENRIIDLGGTASTGAFIIVFNQLGYIIGNILLYIFKFTQLKFLFFIGLLIDFISLLFIAIDYFFNVNNFQTMISICFGLTILGLSNSLLLIPHMPYNIASLKKLFPNKNERLIHDMASGIFTVSIACAEFQGPIIGGLFNEWVSFSSSVLLYSIILILYLVWYGVKGGAIKNWYEKVEEENKELEMKAILL